MRLIVTDTCNIFNVDDPFWEKFKDILLVVCLNGREITDKYECFVSPYEQVGMGIDRYGTEDMKFKALASAAGKLNYRLGYHDRIVFLSDNEVSSLYPFFVLKDMIKHNGVHLITSSPFRFESKKRFEAHNKMLNDLSGLNSLLYYESNSVFKENEKLTLQQAYDELRNYFIKILPHVLNCINNMRYKEMPGYFDFSSMSYIPLRNGFKDIDVSKNNSFSNELSFEPHPSYMTLGMVIPPSYPESYERIHETIERPVPRPDGKQVCNLLREQRIRLAEANNIPFESEECPSTGPCAGTCAKCDAEAEYLRRQMKKIPEDKRVYPQFDPTSSETANTNDNSSIGEGEIFGQPSWLVKMLYQKHENEVDDDNEEDRI